MEGTRKRPPGANPTATDPRPPPEPGLLDGDRALLERFRQGDPAALLTVYRAYAPGVARLLRRGFEFRSDGRACRFHGARTTFELEDRLQEVFARAFRPRARAAYDGLTPYAAYIAQIAKNLVIDDFRRKERALVSYSWELPERPAEGAVERPSEPLDGLFTPSGDPQADAERKELGAVVEAVVERLGPREAAVFRLRFLEGLEHAEIAARTGHSVSKVKTSEERIRKAFFRALHARGFFEGYAEERRGWLRRARAST